MPLVDGQGTGTSEMTEAGYLDPDPGDAPVSIHMNLDAVDGIVHDVAEEFDSLPQRVVEVGGLLLGHVKAGEKPSIRIERYQRIPCQHSYGPQFSLDEADRSGLERAAAAILEGGEMAVVGLYRSHTREGFQPEIADYELIRRYFSDASDLLLLIKPESTGEMAARFYAHDSEGGVRAAGEAFPFHGRVLSSGGTGSHKPKEEPKAEAAGPGPARRLVPDFVPSPVEPARAAAEPAGQFLFPPRDRVMETEEIERPSAGARLLRWIPLVLLLLGAGGAIWWFSQPLHESPVPVAAATPGEPARPLGLAVGPMGKALDVSWNANATALNNARSVQLFVRDGDDQNRIDLSPRDLAAGSYEYQPAGNDVTFRLEVVDSTGRLAAESFRFERVASMPTPAARPDQAPAPAAPVHVIHRTEPKAIRRAPPVVAAGIRPRITGAIPVDVRVRIDEHGRVVSAAPVLKPHGGLEAYLAGSAVQAARQWRFDPARENGKPVPGSQTIHFVFEK